jgi:hypothetical protein
MHFGRTNTPSNIVCQRPHGHVHHRLSVSLIFGAAGTSPAAAITGGLVARGEGTWSELLGPKPSELLRLGVNGGGLPADPDAEAAAGGCVPELNSAQRGHLRFVSERKKMMVTHGQHGGGKRRCGIRGR